MNQEIFGKLESIFSKQKNRMDVDWDYADSNLSLSERFQCLLDKETVSEPEMVRNRMKSELTGLGPLDTLLTDPEITEILVNNHKEIYFEKNGKLAFSHDHFYSEQSYLAVLDRLSQKCGSYLNREKPFVEAQFGRMRITIIFGEISRGTSLLSIRLQPIATWTMDALLAKNWCSQLQADLINQIFIQKKNFLVVGGTGSGKTSFLQALLQKISKTERAVIIEDTQELQLPDSASVSLLTRQDPSASVGDITMDDLLKRALRLRPDRLVVGEIRGAEAKSLMMAMATGHDGSFGSLHARTAQEALIRLEMLIQMGAPQWSLQSIRKLIAMTIQNIIVVEKRHGLRKLNGIFEITSVEETGITLDQIDEV
jgi:pilus assembly protein CpaF